MSESKNRVVLVVDDDLTALDLMDIMLERRGFEVIRRTGGREALESLDKSTPGVIVIDLMMPGMNGQECVRQIRARGLEVPIIAFTALDDPVVHKEAMQAGCNLVLTKPCDPKTIVAEIDKLVCGRKE